MAILHVHIKVQDYQVWRRVFDENFGLREQFGCQSETVLVNANDDKDIVIILVFDSLASAQQFNQSTELRTAMQNAGVIPPPQAIFMEER